MADGTTTSRAVTNPLATAIAATGAVAHDATNKHMGYGYASAESLIDEGRAALANAGLSLIPVGMTLTPRTDGGATAVLVTEWVLREANRDTPIKIEWPVVVERGRPIDKAVAAARTASLGYLIRDLLLLPRTEKGTRMDDDERERNRLAEEKDQREAKEKAAKDAAAHVAKEKARVAAARARIAAVFTATGIPADKQRQSILLWAGGGDVMPVSGDEWETVADTAEWEHKQAKDNAP